MSSIGSSSPQAPRPTISAQAFKERFGAQAMSVTELSQAKRTQALDAAQADLNGDGMIQGEAEAATLFRQLSGALTGARRPEIDLSLGHQGARELHRCRRTRLARSGTTPLS